MKRITIFCLMIFMLAMSISCSKEVKVMDELVGTYLLTGSQYVTWGHSSGTLSVNDYLTFTDTGNNTFKMSGYFDTTGSIVGDNINFHNWTVYDTSGRLSYRIQSTRLLGGTMYLYVTHSGELKAEGRYYPCNANYILTATKMY